METYYHKPTERPLSDAVQFFWQINRCNADFTKETIVPKGVVEVIFNFLPEEPLRARLYQKHLVMPRCFIQGYHNYPIELALPESQFLFGVVLHTVATQHILRVPAGELARQCIDLTLIDASLNSLWHQLAEQKTFWHRVSLFSGWLLKRLPGLTPREHALNDLLTSKTDMLLSVSGISEWLCYSARHLCRKFYALTGMNAEQTLLYLKYRKAIDMIHYSGLSLTEIAYACQFSDQSHFIKTFKSFVNLTPGEYRNKKSEIVGHCFEVVR